MADQHGSGRTPLEARTRIASILCVAVVAACGVDSTPFHPSEPGGSGGPQDVQRADLSITVVVETADAPVAAALDFPGGAVPHTEVTIRRTGTSTELTAVTDDEGRAVFDRLLPGNYQISAIRLLTEAERDRLPPDHADVNALGGGRGIDLAAPGVEAAVPLTAGRPGSLVISEKWFGDFMVEGSSYPWGRFIELYNNSDTTIFVDGKLLARPHVYGYDYPGTGCNYEGRYDRFTIDPDGIWVPYAYRFPGSGTQYPVRPGQAIVVALEAIDHRPYSDGQLDLSRADFEFHGELSPDNPHVPNLVSVGPRVHGIGRGLMWVSLNGVIVLADRVDIATLPHDFLPGEVPVVRIPAEKILDVVSYWAIYDAANPPCERMVAERFDRQGARVLASAMRASMKRRPLLTLPDGRILLQRTLTGARDFMAGPPSPGTVP